MDMTPVSECLVCDSSQEAETKYFHGKFWICSSCISAIDEEGVAIKKLMQLPGGFSIMNEGMVTLRQLEDGRWAVTIEDKELSERYSEEKIFENIDLAIDLFLQIRYQEELGLDFFLEAFRLAGLIKPPEEL